MLSIRLSRVGKKKAPMFRFVVQPKTRDPWAKSLAILGHYNPRTKECVVATEKAQTWIKNGAECSDSVWNLFVEHKVVTGEKRGKSHLSKKRQASMEKELAEQKAKAEAAAEKAQAAKAAAEEAEKAEAEAANAAAETPAPAEEVAA